MSAAAPTLPPAVEPAEHAVVARVLRRLVPFMCFLYFLNYIDRTNIQIAKLEINRALNLNDAQYGLAAGIFFVGYCLFEIPSNLILARVGARRWIARIMVSWGLVCALMFLIRGPKSFYALRLLLGFAEAGFFPGMVLYLSYWVPQRARARAFAWFLTSTALAGCVGAPLGALLLQLKGLGLAGWQWVFVLEGLPTIVFGVIVFFVLPDRPADARWLDDDEKAILRRRLDAEHALTHHHVRDLWPALVNPTVWLMCAIYSLIVFGYYWVNFWTASIIKEGSTHSTLVVGLLSSIPFLSAAVGMVAAGVIADRTAARRVVVAACAAAGCVGMFCCAFADTTLTRISYLSLAAAGLWGTLGPFWALPHQFLRGTAAAAGVALINSVGNLVGGFLGPYVVGELKELTKSFRSGLLLTSAVLFLAVILTPLLRPHRVRRDASADEPAPASPA
jgi:ACS family tartrate transporter-like MFS transporter